MPAIDEVNARAQAAADHAAAEVRRIHHEARRKAEEERQAAERRKAEDDRQAEVRRQVEERRQEAERLRIEQNKAEDRRQEAEKRRAAAQREAKRQDAGRRDSGRNQAGPSNLNADHIPRGNSTGHSAVIPPRVDRNKGRAHATPLDDEDEDAAEEEDVDTQPAELVQGWMDVLTQARELGLPRWAYSLAERLYQLDRDQAKVGREFGRVIERLAHVRGRYDGIEGRLEDMETRLEDALQRMTDFENRTTDRVQQLEDRIDLRVAKIRDEWREAMIVQNGWVLDRLDTHGERINNWHARFSRLEEHLGVPIPEADEHCVQIPEQPPSMYHPEVSDEEDEEMAELQKSWEWDSLMPAGANTRNKAQSDDDPMGEEEAGEGTGSREGTPRPEGTIDAAHAPASSVSPIRRQPQLYGRGSNSAHDPAPDAAGTLGPAPPAGQRSAPAAPSTEVAVTSGGEIPMGAGIPPVAAAAPLSVSAASGGDNPMAAEPALPPAMNIIPPTPAGSQEAQNVPVVANADVEMEDVPARDGRPEGEAVQKDKEHSPAPEATPAPAAPTAPPLCSPPQALFALTSSSEAPPPAALPAASTAAVHPHPLETAAPALTTVVTTPSNSGQLRPDPARAPGSLPPSGPHVAAGTVLEPGGNNHHLQVPAPPGRGRGRGRGQRSRTPSPVLGSGVRTRSSGNMSG